MGYSNLMVGTGDGVVERPILFSGEMIRAILEGRKTQTRRVITRPKWALADFGGDVCRLTENLQTPAFVCGTSGCLASVDSPYGQPGGRLWVKETHRQQSGSWPTQPDANRILEFRADAAFHGVSDIRWRPSIFMPRWASRLTLEVESVRVEQVQDISEEDALAEGIQGFDFPVPPDPPGQTQRAFGLMAYFPQCEPTAARAYARLWDRINDRPKRKYPWSSNPWVWVIGFRRVGA